ncbi:THAP domain-containing protein 11 [Labeo rohita]|uniref:THAP domain-containing protein 11 n=1 Tax=Labeo rohita TaxID=84645 RepID=A0ABQ8MZC1_LABRO|nr:THAP domain-containing protein 11 [Labeo rohita]
MVNYCHVLGCTNRSDREKHLEYYRLPKVITNQEEECKNLSEKQEVFVVSQTEPGFQGKNLDNIHASKQGKTVTAGLRRQSFPRFLCGVNRSAVVSHSDDAQGTGYSFKRSAR